ncbi:MAG: hypothetical protein HY343_02500 [Lentisphaerae bacterium]|nr:hypothetical protein [Lentisphaerota bacterium]
MKFDLQRFFFFGAGLAVLAGLVMSGLTLRQLPEQARLWKQKQTVLRQLQALKANRAQREATVRLFEDLPSAGAGPTPAELAQQAVPDASPSFQDKGVTAVSSNWSLRAVEVSFQDAALEPVSRFAVTLETQRPPWKVTGFRIAASRPDGGYGHVTLTLEHLERNR